MEPKRRLTPEQLLGFGALVVIMGSLLVMSSAGYHYAILPAVLFATVQVIRAINQSEG